MFTYINLSTVIINYNYIHERSCEKSHNVLLSLFSINIYSNNIYKYSRGN